MAYLFAYPYINLKLENLEMERSFFIAHYKDLKKNIAAIYYTNITEIDRNCDEKFVCEELLCSILHVFT